jgi:hypothetical protein
VTAMCHTIITILLALAAFGTSSAAAWYWYKSSQVEIIGTAPGTASISDVPEIYIMGAQGAIMQSSALNAIAAKWTAAAAVLSALTSIWGAI